MDVLDAIHKRRAVRQFSEQAVPDSVIEEIVAAGGRSQSSKNTQPWRFIVVRDRDTLQKLSTLGDYAGHIAGANFAVVLVGNQESTWNAFDLGQAAAQMQLAATSLGVGSCIAAMYRPDEAKALLGIPADRTAFCVLSFGYPAPTHQPARMGGRRPISDVITWERWQD